jgi:hypothetical protein
MKTLIALACIALATTAHAWTYADHQDQLSGGQIHTASVTSSTVIELGFPYQGPQRAELVLRKHPRESQAAMLLIERGQLQDKGMTVRFDDSQPVRFDTVGVNLQVK